MLLQLGHSDDFSSLAMITLYVRIMTTHIIFASSIILVVLLIFLQTLHKFIVGLGILD